jgi:hypothetical protein
VKGTGTELQRTFCFPECSEKKSSLEEENKKLKQLVEELKKENDGLQKYIKYQESKFQEAIDKKIEETLAKYFTPGQIRIILNPGKRIVWSTLDISVALSLRYVSAKAYRYLRSKLLYPLPSISTLKSWVVKHNFKPGLQTSVLAIMKNRGDQLTCVEKLTVISFDEMKIKAELCIDRKLEQVLGPHDSVQVVMARGLIGKWKQPIFYGFDKPMTKSLLFSVILSLEKSGYHVVAQVSDLGPSNRGLWRKLSVDVHHSWFQNPYDPARQIYIFADVPHLMKLFRNHLVDKGFVLGNGKVVTVSILEKLLSLQKEVNIIPKVTWEHLHPSLFRRQKVK